MKHFFCLFFVTLLFISCSNDDKVKNNAEEETEITEPQYMYGICIDSLDVEHGVIKKNEFLSNILLEKDVSYNVIDYIARHHKKVFDVRKIKRGNKYTFMMTRDSIPQAKYWIYEINKKDFVVFCLTDSLQAWRDQKQITTTIETSGNVITSSLWNAIAEEGADPNLTMMLSDIYAWTIDFFGIQPGAEYRGIYEKKHIEGGITETGKILAAYLSNNNVEYYAYLFCHDDEEDYYDTDGENLRKTFLKAPLNYRRISSTFSEARRHPVTKIVRPHHGVDYAAPTGTPVQSVADGTVIEKGYQKNGGGNYLKIRHNSTYTTVYMHLNSFAKGINKGTRVKQGQVIGYVGSTGLSTGPHLDYRMIKNGKYINPLKFKSPAAEPVKKEYMDEFKIVKARMDSIFDNITTEPSINGNNTYSDD